MRLVQTCGACPEQYDVFDKDHNLVGYLRLRHGHFTARYPNGGGEIVYSADTFGDGAFHEDERDFHLANALEAIKNEMNRHANASERLRRLLDE